MNKNNTNWIYDLDYTLYQFDKSSKFDYNNLTHNPKLNRNLVSLKGKKILFTNGNLLHTLTCIKKMNLEGIFHKVSCRELSGFKPDINSYLRLNKIANLNFQDTNIFFEDTIENLIMAKNIGWITVFISPNFNIRNNVKRNFKKIDYVFSNIIEATDYFLNLQHKKNLT